MRCASIVPTTRIWSTIRKPPATDDQQCGSVLAGPGDHEVVPIKFRFLGRIYRAVSLARCASGVRMTECNVRRLSL
jgi:hypothetical protein